MRLTYSANARLDERCNTENRGLLNRSRYRAGTKEIDIKTKRNRWCIYIDILGFSRLWECDEYKAHQSIYQLTSAIHQVGTKVYLDEPDRLFVHQMGDGFSIVSSHGEQSLKRPIAIAIALMRHIAANGTFAAAAIAEGEYGDHLNLYPDELRNHRNYPVCSLGKGIITLNSTMGMAFIRAYRLNSVTPSGPFVIVPEKCRNRIPEDLWQYVRPTKSRKNGKLLSIDWVHADSDGLSCIQEKADICAPSQAELVQIIQNYCRKYECIGGKWSCNLRSLLGIEIERCRRH